MVKSRLTAVRLRELLSVKRVSNDAELLNDVNGRVPLIVFRKRDNRTKMTPAWQVLVSGKRTDALDGNVRDGFNKTFHVDLSDPQDRAVQLDAAKKWASETYGVTEWVKTPFGAWTSREHLEERLRVLLPREFDPEYRDPTVQKIVEKIYGDDASDEPDERMFRVVVQLYAKPEPPLYVKATDAEAAHRQVTQLFTRLAGTRVLDGLRLNVYDA